MADCSSKVRLSQVSPYLRSEFRYGHRLGYDSIEDMIGVANKFEGEVRLTPESRIYCAELDKFVPCNLSVDKDLAGIGITFPMAATKGKKLSTEETEPILDLIAARAEEAPQVQTYGTFVERLSVRGVQRNVLPEEM